MVATDRFYLLVLATTSNMRHYHHLSQVAQIVQLLQDGKSTRAMATKFVPLSTISRVWWRYHREIPQQQDQYLLLCERKNGRWPTKPHVYVLDQTVRNRLHEGGMRG